MAEEGLDHDQIIDGGTPLAAVPSGHGDAEQSGSLYLFEDLLVGRLVRLVPGAGLVPELGAERLGSLLQIALGGGQLEVHRGSSFAFSARHGGEAARAPSLSQRSFTQHMFARDF